MESEERVVIMEPEFEKSCVMDRERHHFLGVGNGETSPRHSLKQVFVAYALQENSDFFCNSVVLVQQSSGTIARDLQ